MNSTRALLAVTRVAACAFVVLLSGPEDRVQGQTSMIAPDPLPADERPGLTDRIMALAAGRVQMEGGYVYLVDESAGVRATQHAVPDMLLRVGLTDRLEVRLGWPGFVSTHFDQPNAAASSSGTVDPNVGFMYDLISRDGLIPQTAVLASVPITLTGNSFAQESLQPLSQVLYNWYLGERLIAGGATGVALFRESGDNFTQWRQTVSVDYLCTDSVSIFAELQLLANHGSADDGWQSLIAGGLSHPLTNRAQLTWRAGLGLNDRAPDFLAGVHFAYRF